jgi:hypothetical protein
MCPSALYCVSYRFEACVDTKTDCIFAKLKLLHVAIWWLWCSFQFANFQTGILGMGRLHLGFMAIFLHPSNQKLWPYLNNDHEHLSIGPIKGKSPHNETLILKTMSLKINESSYSRVAVHLLFSFFIRYYNFILWMFWPQQFFSIRRVLVEIF